MDFCFAWGLMDWCGEVSLSCFRVSSWWVTIANSFSHNTSSKFCKARRFAGLPQPFSSLQQKKKMPTFYLLVLFLELSGRCVASSHRSCGNITFGVDADVLCIKRSVSILHAVKSCIKAAAYMQVFNFLCGFYSSAAFIWGWLICKNPESAKSVKAVWYM